MIRGLALEDYHHFFPAAQAEVHLDSLAEGVVQIQGNQ